MTDKSVISRYTYRTEESQRKDHAGLPVFLIPEELHLLFRKTNRPTKDRLHVSSLAIIAESEKDFRSFMSEAKERKAVIVSKEDAKTFIINGNNIENLVKWWRVARQSGASKIGAMRSGDLKRKAADERAKDMTKEEWYNQNIKNAQLVKKYGPCIGTLRRIAGDRGWCKDRQRAAILAETARNRKERRNARTN